MILTLNMKNQSRIRRQKSPRNLGEKLDQQVENIVYKVMTNEGLEETISRAIKRALIELVINYCLLIGFAILLVLGLQVFILTLLLNK